MITERKDQLNRTENLSAYLFLILTPHKEQQLLEPQSFVEKTNTTTQALINITTELTRNLDPKDLKFTKINYLHAQRLKQNIAKTENCKATVDIQNTITIPYMPDTVIVGVLPKTMPYDVPVISSYSNTLLKPSGKIILNSHTTENINPLWPKDPIVFLPNKNHQNYLNMDYPLRNAGRLIAKSSEAASPLAAYHQKRGGHELQIGVPDLYNTVNGKNSTEITKIVNDYAHNTHQKFEKPILPELRRAWYESASEGLSDFSNELVTYMKYARSSFNIPDWLIATSALQWRLNTLDSLNQRTKDAFKPSFQNGFSKKFDGTEFQQNFPAFYTGV